MTETDICNCLPPRVKDIVGLRFGLLEVISYVKTENKKSYWFCMCDCGSEKIIYGNDMKRGATISCGCFNKKRTIEMGHNNRKHGETKSRLHNIWSGMKGRCQNNNNPKYKDYGGRGITVCDEWQTFEPFRDWALANGYQEGLTIDRVDNDGDYTPSNCRWATVVEQAKNKRNNKIISINGEAHCLAEWAAKTGLKEDTISMRIKRGWPSEQLLKPVYSWRRR